MRFLNRLLVSAGFVLANIGVYSQQIPGALGYHEQALMFSQYNFTGSARILGLANTQISLGGDVSSALSNPAGLGFYNRSELVITPSVNIQSANSRFIGSTTNSDLGNFNLANIGVVFNKTKDDIIPGKWRGGSFAISFSKINNFNSDIKYSGNNGNNDILDFYVQDANSQNVDFDELVGVTYGAFVTYLMSEFLDGFVTGNDTTFVPFYERTFFSEFPSESLPTLQEEIISSNGGQNQWNFSYGGNYGDFIYFGATLGIQSLRYEISKRYTETYPGLQQDIVASSSLDEYLLTNGIGVNGTFGLIARPINQMTIGMSLVTPTYLSLSENYSYTSQGNFNNFDMRDYGNYFDANYDLIVNSDANFTTFYEYEAMLNNETYEEESEFDYTVTTPLRLNFGTSFFFNKSGFISADIEYVDYSTMKLKDNQGLIAGDQTTINESYKSTLNIRAGGEFRFKKLRLRAGYSYQPSPYKSEELSSNHIQMYTAGIGYRSRKFYTDMGVSYKRFNSKYAPYILDNPTGESYLQTNFVDIESDNLNLALSVGFFF